MDCLSIPLLTSLCTPSQSNTPTTTISLRVKLCLLESKSLGFIPVMTLHFLHGVLVSFQCLGVLIFGCKPCLECPLDIIN
mmetsp:Transcript_35608/g.85008  ORF Transcript_35608/g.85008 Transcript_35608/m.85008 type:complete len:80 (-) Transcript_35608:131-370(-)